MGERTRQILQQSKQRKHNGEKTRRPSHAAPGNKAQGGGKVSHAYKVRNKETSGHPLWN
jgi:hypothetical protein